MPRSRGRKNRRKAQRVTKGMIAERTREIVDAQRQRFREKFGRDWQANDPVFFDPDADMPTLMSEVKIQAEVLEAMRKAGTPPQIVYAYKKTGGLLLREDMREHWPADRVKEWEDAIDEYFAIEEANEGVNKPNPEEWSTQIPEMLASGFSQEDLEKVSEILAAIAPIEGREPLKVIVRIEIAAAFLATACSAAYDSAEPTGSPARDLPSTLRLKTWWSSGRAKSTARAGDDALKRIKSDAVCHRSRQYLRPAASPGTRSPFTDGSSGVNLSKPRNSSSSVSVSTTTSVAGSSRPRVGRSD